MQQFETRVATGLSQEGNRILRKSDGSYLYESVNKLLNSIGGALPYHIMTENILPFANITNCVDHNLWVQRLLSRIYNCFGPGSNLCAYDINLHIKYLAAVPGIFKFGSREQLRSKKVFLNVQDEGCGKLFLLPEIEFYRRTTLCVVNSELGFGKPFENLNGTAGPTTLCTSFEVSWSVHCDKDYFQPLLKASYKLLIETFPKQDILCSDDSKML